MLFGKPIIAANVRRTKIAVSALISVLFNVAS